MFRAEEWTPIQTLSPAPAPPDAPTHKYADAFTMALRHLDHARATS